MRSGPLLPLRRYLITSFTIYAWTNHHLGCPPAAQAQIWQLNFAVSPEALQEINMAMRVNEDILRWVVVKRGLEKMPSHRKLFHQLSEYAEFLTPPTRQQGGNLGL